MDYTKTLQYTKSLYSYLQQTPEKDWVNQEEYYLLRSKYIHLRMLCIIESFLCDLPTPEIPSLPPTKHSQQLVDAIVDNCIHKYELTRNSKWVYTLSNANGFVVGKATSLSLETAKTQAIQNAKNSIEFGENYAKQMNYTP